MHLHWEITGLPESHSKRELGKHFSTTLSSKSFKYIADPSSIIIVVWVWFTMTPRESDTLSPLWGESCKAYDRRRSYRFATNFIMARELSCCVHNTHRVFYPSITWLLSNFPFRIGGVFPGSWSFISIVSSTYKWINISKYIILTLQFNNFNMEPDSQLVLWS